MKMHNARLDKNNNLIKLDQHEGQFNYLGRWVNKDTFRAFVYNEKGEQKLADSYKEFENLINSGIWFDKKPAPKERRNKDDTIRSAG